MSWSRWISSTSSNSRNCGPNFRYSLPEIAQRPCILGIALFERPAELGLARLTLGRRDDQRLPIGGHLQGCVRVDAQQVHDRPVDDQGEAVAVLGQGLDHGGSPPVAVTTMYHQ